MSQFSKTCGEWDKNAIIGVNNSSSTHVDNRKKDLGDISKDFTVDNMKKKTKVKWTHV